jgi:hypothetical protein
MTRRRASTRWCADDLLLSSPRQAYLRVLGYPEPTYAHVALVLNEDGALAARRRCHPRRIGAERALAQIASSLGSRGDPEQMLRSSEPLRCARESDLPPGMSRTLVNTATCQLPPVPHLRGPLAVMLLAALILTACGSSGNNNGENGQGIGSVAVGTGCVFPFSYRPATVSSSATTSTWLGCRRQARREGRIR